MATRPSDCSAREQAALRRVATLVARAAAPQEVLAAIAEEAGRLLGTDHATMSRYGADGMITMVAAWNSTGAAFAVGTAALTASRARIVPTADATRRRIERDLHDGAQQRLVSLGLRLRKAQAVADAWPYAARCHPMQGLVGRRAISVQSPCGALPGLQRGPTGGARPTRSVVNDLRRRPTTA